MFADVVSQPHPHPHHLGLVRHRPNPHNVASSWHQAHIPPEDLLPAMAALQPDRRNGLSPLSMTTVNSTLRSPHASPFNANTAAMMVKPAEMNTRSDGRNGEHMLRRKTPNGTLSAGYDGTPVDWSAAAHAPKLRVLSSQPAASSLLTPPPLPMASSFLPLASTSADRAPTSALPLHMRHNSWTPPASTGNAAIPLGLVSTWIPANWPGQLRGSPTIDSVLDQTLGPAPALFQSANAYHQIPTALQPSWSLAAAPTASNAQNGYGPYWPDGSFEPYRPATSQDRLGFMQSISGPSTFPAGANLQPLLSAPLPWPSPHPPQNYQPAQFDSFWARRNRSNLLHHLGPSTTPRVTDGTSFLPPLEANQSSATWNNSPSHTPQTSNRISYPYTAYSEAGLPPSPQAFRLRVLTWAHRVYVNLIQHSRRQAPNKQSLEKDSSQPSFFPRPPRHSLSGAPESSRRHSLLREPPQVPNPASPRPHSNPEHAAKVQQAQPQVPGRPRSVFHERHDRGLRLRQSHLAQSQVPPISSSIRHVSDAGISTNGLHNDLRRALPDASPITDAQSALEMLERLCQDSAWQWVDGMLLGGCLAYGLEQFDVALQWYNRVLQFDPDNVEAISNMAAACLSLKQRKAAEQYWYRAVKIRPSYFEAVEHLVGLLCSEQRGADAVKVIEYVGTCLRLPTEFKTKALPATTRSSVQTDENQKSKSADADDCLSELSIASEGCIGYRIAPCDHGRLLALVHAKGNMLYALGDTQGAAKAFEDAIIISSGRRFESITSLIKQILSAFERLLSTRFSATQAPVLPCETILLRPETALKTAELVFPGGGQLPGLRDVLEGQPKRAAVSVASNSLLSLAKIYQDGMSASASTASTPAQATPGVPEILALYYLSLSLQPSPSTANNVGILLAGVQHCSPHEIESTAKEAQVPTIPGVRPGSGIALALLYYNYGLNLDNRHAHLYTNLGSLLKDIGQLNAAIKMYEQAVNCDGTFDIALANLANAVKDQGRIADAIGYYRRAVHANPDFAEAVCGLANALNSVCSWKGRGGVVFRDTLHDRWHVDEQGVLTDGRSASQLTSGWIGRVVDIVDKQLSSGQAWGRGVLHSAQLRQMIVDGSLRELTGSNSLLQKTLSQMLEQWTDRDWEGANLLRLFERATRRLSWQMYQNMYIKKQSPPVSFARPQLPASLVIPGAPTVLPFHTFTCPLTATQVRKISQRNGMRISCSTLKAPWLSSNVFPPPPPPHAHLNVGYVSSDFNNHPLAHLMQSVFGFHDRTKVKAYCYATTASDQSPHRAQIEREAPVFHDASAWPTDRLVKQIVADGIHILVNLNGYTRGARNEVFAARPAPIQMSFMGFAGTLGAEWCDYLLADAAAVPPSMLRPYRSNVSLTDLAQDGNFDDSTNWVYSENVIFARQTFFCCDHRQSAPDAQEAPRSWEVEQARRRAMRKDLFPDLADDVVILGNFNQLYKIEPTTFRTWLRILQAQPKAILWLLRFPDAGEAHLRASATSWASASVAARIRFTDVAPKHAHISRAAICDLVLDTPECNAHTTAADVLWSGTPLLTLPRYEYKMCSRMAASILRGALPYGPTGEAAAWELIATDEADYERKAIALTQGLLSCLQQKSPSCRLWEFRQMLYGGRHSSALFDTRRWVRDLEEAYGIAWQRWVDDEGGDIWL